MDASVLKEIEKAINASDIGIAPQNDGKVIRLNFPPLTEERRKELVKTVKKYTEEAKVQNFVTQDVTRLIRQGYEERRRNHRGRFERNRKGYTRLDR